MADCRRYVYLTALWRISIFSDLEGLSGERESARWHTAAPEKRIAYLSEHPAVALVEVLVNMHGKPGFEDLTVNWRENFEESGFIGDSWLASGSSALLGVPSAPSPECTNYLLNPLHPDSRGMTIEWCKWIQYDKRLFRV